MGYFLSGFPRRIDSAIAGLEEAKNLAGKCLRLIQMRVATRRLEKSRQYVKSIRCKRASLIQPQQTQSAFHDVHNETLSAAPDVDPQVRNWFSPIASQA